LQSSATRSNRPNAVIKAHIRRTPVVELDGADFGLPGFPLGSSSSSCNMPESFKTRGAFANLLQREVPAPAWWLPRAATTARPSPTPRCGWACPARIFVPTVSSPAKISRIRDYGAELVVVATGMPTRSRQPGLGRQLRRDGGARL